MKLRIAAWWNWLISTFWFLPGILMASAIALAIGAPLLDIRIDEGLLERAQWLEMSPSAAQQVLASIAGAMVTVAGVVFSITMVTLSIATSQLGPRLLRTFMSNLTTQFTLGLFVGTSLYCLLVLATVRTNDEFSFVPHVAVLLGVLLAVLCLSVLIFFTHSVATLVQAPNIVREVARDLDHAIDRVFPEPRSRGATSRRDHDDVQRCLNELGEPAFSVTAPFEGYIQSLDLAAIIRAATARDLIVRLRDRPGKFVVRDQAIADVWWHGERGNADDVRHELVAAYGVGNRPTPVQDIEGAINELVEVALRALSPSLNDPFTALHCIDRLSASLSRLAVRDIPPPIRRDEAGIIRIVTPPFDFPTVLETAFNQIRQYGRDSVAATIRLLEALAVVGEAAGQDADRAAVELQAKLVLQGVERVYEEPYDLEAVRQRYRDVVRVLSQ